VIAQVLAHPRQGVAHFYAQCLQPLRLADARQLEQLGRVDRAAAHHDVASRPRLALFAAD